MRRKPYPSDISEGVWHFVALYLTLMAANAPQRRHDLREVFQRAALACVRRRAVATVAA